MAALDGIRMHAMAPGRRILVLPADWTSTRPAGDPRRELASDLAIEETARALCRELQQRAILAAITHRK